MASKLKTASLKVTLKEDIVLNGKNVGGKTEISFSGIKQADTRFLNIPTHEVTILQLSSSAGAGTYTSGSFKYARITNLDDTNFLNLAFVSGSNNDGAEKSNRYNIKLEAGMSHMFFNNDLSGSAQGSNFTKFTGFNSISAFASTASIDTEIFVATT